MGKIKYENLGIDYPLKDTKPLPRERAIEAKKIVLQGIKDRRLEDNNSEKPQMRKKFICGFCFAHIYILIYSYTFKSVDYSLLHISTLHR